MIPYNLSIDLTDILERISKSDLKSFRLKSGKSLLKELAICCGASYILGQDKLTFGEYIPPFQTLPNTIGTLVQTPWTASPWIPYSGTVTGISPQTVTTGTTGVVTTGYCENVGTVNPVTNS